MYQNYSLKQLLTILNHETACFYKNIFDLAYLLGYELTNPHTYLVTDEHHIQFFRFDFVRVHLRDPASPSVDAAILDLVTTLSEHQIGSPPNA